MIRSIGHAAAAALVWAFVQPANAAAPDSARLVGQARSASAFVLRVKKKKHSDDAPKSVDDCMDCIGAPTFTPESNVPPPADNAANATAAPPQSDDTSTPWPDNNDLPPLEPQDAGPTAN